MKADLTISISYDVLKDADVKARLDELMTAVAEAERRQEEEINEELDRQRFA